MIEPRILKGFRDYLPEAMIPREWLIQTCQKVYRSFGFAPIETPTLELFEVLTGKGSEETDRQMYHFVDQGERHVGMRFDLTVPLARFVAQHSHELTFPFKRYHIGTVWRGEAPQAGRYREFMQCDFDTIGSTSLTSDIETGLVIVELLTALGLDNFQVRLNNRKVLNGILAKHGLQEQAVAVLRAIDKLPKIGPQAVAQELQTTAQLSTEQIAAVLTLAGLKGDNASILQELESLAAGDELAERGCEELRTLVATYEALKMPQQRIQLDPSIARGLDYYTGTIFETFLLDKPEIGSVCSGGRYDNLAELFTKEQLPGIGASLGLDRLLTALQMMGRLPAGQTTASILVAQFQEGDRAAYFQIAAQLRRRGLNVEVFPEPKKLGAQFKYAAKKGFAVVLVAGPDELAQHQIQAKWLADGSQTLLPLSADVGVLADWLQERISSAHVI